MCEAVEHVIYNSYLDTALYYNIIIIIIIIIKINIIYNKFCQQNVIFEAG